jgi:hypothetical protein
MLRARLVAKGREYFQRNNWETLKPKYLGILDNLGRDRRTALEQVKGDV